MAQKTYSEQFSFDLGEIDPEFVVRHDTDVVRRSARRIVNWFPTASGGLRRRPALKYFGTDKWLSSSGWDILVTTYKHGTATAVADSVIHVESTAASGVEGYLRVYQVRDGSARTNLTSVLTTIPLPAWIHAPTGAHVYGGDATQFGSAMFLTGPEYLVRLVGTGVDSIMTLDTPTLYKELRGLWDFPANQSATAWSITAYANEGTPESTSHSEDTIASAEDDNADKTFVGGGLLMPLLDVVTANVASVAAGGKTITMESSNWRYGRWDAQVVGQPWVNSSSKWGTEDGSHYPLRIDFFQGRMVLTAFGSDANDPGRAVRVQMSYPGNFRLMYPRNAEDLSPIEIELGAQNAGQIRWCYSMERWLFLGTPYQVLAIPGPDGGVTPSNVGYITALTRGSHWTRPTRLDDILLYLSEGRRSVNGIQFNQVGQRFAPIDFGVRSSRINRDIDDLDVVLPHKYDTLPRLFAVKGTGSAGVWTPVGDQLGAWTEFEVSEDHVGQEITLDWVTEITGTPVFLAVRADGKFAFLQLDYAGWDDPFLLDFKQDATGSGTSWNVADTLFHGRKAMAVVTWMDGSTARQYIQEVNVDASGNFSVDQVATSVEIGFPFRSEIDLFDPVPQNASGRVFGEVHRVRSVAVYLKNTRQFAVNGEPFATNVPFTAGQAPPLLPDGWHSVNFSGFGETPAMLTLQAMEGYNAHVLAVVREVSA